MSKKPEGFHSITPHFMVNGARQAIELYKKALGAEEILAMSMPGTDIIMHAAIKVGDSVMFLSDPYEGGDRTPPAEGTVSATAFYHYVDDVDAAFKQAVRAGMTAIADPEDMFWGDRTAVVTDGFGYNWTLATFIREVSEEEMGAVMAEMAKQG